VMKAPGGEDLRIFFMGGEEGVNVGMEIWWER